jgi:hypothetical protein
MERNTEQSVVHLTAQLREGRSPLAESGVGKEAIDAAHRLQRRGKGGLNRNLISHVHGFRVRPWRTECFERDDRLAVLLRAPPPHDHIRALLGATLQESQPDSAIGSRRQDNLAVQIK